LALPRTRLLVDDICPASGEAQLTHYVEYIQQHYPHWWNDDAVPIYWSVMGDGDGFGSEQAPFNPDGDNVLTYYYPPINVRTGQQINWYKLPVINNRFPEFAAALGWLPAPGQLFAPLRSIVEVAPQPPRPVVQALEITN
jgi:hypothetical protein